MRARVLFAVPAVLAGCYYGLALIAGLRRSGRRQKSPPSETPPVSILKPVNGWHDRIAEAIASHARQDYPEFELLLGVRESDAAAAAEIRRVQQAWPNSPIRMVPVRTVLPNRKAGSLVDLAAAARHSLLVINDADIWVERDYLRSVVSPLRNPEVGLVTALYRAGAGSFAAGFEALGVATEFAPSVLVARLLGVAEFALGSTMAVRASDLERIGGFRPIGDYLADDYQLGARITGLGLHVAFADSVVETSLGAGSWKEVWKHQVRWSRTIRVSRPSGYYGYVITQATFWACIAAAAGYGTIAAAVLAIRVLAGTVIARRVLKDDVAASRWWLIPARDLFGFAVWLMASFGQTVEWGGRELHLTPDGRIHPAGD